MADDCEIHAIQSFFCSWSCTRRGEGSFWVFFLNVFLGIFLWFSVRWVRKSVRQAVGQSVSQPSGQAVSQSGRPAAAVRQSLWHNLW